MPSALDAVLAGVLTASRLGVVLLTAGGRVRWANPAAESLLLDRCDVQAQWYDLPLRTLLAADEGPLAELARLEARLAEPLPDAQARPPRAVEARSADGRRWLRLELQMLPPWVRDHHGLAGALALSDATAARQAREAAGREGTLLREAARLGQVGAWDIDARSGQLRWSDEAFAIHDLPPGAPPDSATALRYFDVTSRPRLNEAVQQAVQAGVPFDLTLGLVSATGRHKRVRVIGNADLDERGKVARVAGLLHDITDRERHLQALAAQESAERARLALAQAMAQLADQLATPLGELSGAVARLDDRARELPAWAAAPLQSLQHAAALLGRWMHELHRQALGMGAAQADFDGQVHPARHDFEVALGNRHPSQQSGAAPAASAAQGCNVLYIEDHPVNALLVREALALQQPCHQLRVAETGEDGLRMVAEQRPDVVLLDLNLPGASGYDVLAQLRADPATAALPCVAVSADAMPDELLRARQAGFVDYWTKPLVMAGLAQRIHEVAATHRVGRSTPPGPRGS